MPPWPVGRRVLLVERQLVAVRRDHPVVEVAPLAIGERVDLPRPAADDAGADVLALAAGVRPGEAQHAVVLERQAAQLQRQVIADGLDQPRGGRPAVVLGAHGGRHALVLGGGEEALAPVPPPADHRVAVADLRREGARQLGFRAIVDHRFAGEQAEIPGVGAFELDRARDRARAERAGAAAARDDDVAQALGRDRRQRDIAEERVRHRHAVEQHLRPAGGVAAERAQGHPLGRGVGRAAVRPPELLEPGDVLQRVVEPPGAGGGNLLLVERGVVVGRRRRSLREPLAGDDDLVRGAGTGARSRVLRKGRSGGNRDRSERQVLELHGHPSNSLVDFVRADSEARLPCHLTFGRAA